MGTIKMKDRMQEVLEKVNDGFSKQTETVTEEQISSGPIGALFEEKKLRGENTKFWRMNDGTMRQIITPNAIHYRNANGEFCEIDNRLSEKDSAYEAVSGERKIQLAKDASNSDIISIEKGDTKLSWQFKKRPAKGASVMRMRKRADEQNRFSMVSNSENGVSYENIEDGIDLEYELCGMSVKENIIVKEKREEYRFDFTLDTTGYRVALSEDNRSIELYAGDKKEYIIPEPFMYDANGAKSEEVYYEMEQLADGQYTFTVVAEPTWINSEERALPVTIDPQIVTSQSELCFMKTYSQTCSTYYWKEENYNYMRVANDNYYIKYKGTLGINKTKFPLNEQKIIKASVVLKPYSKSGSGGLMVGAKYYPNNGMANMIIDITKEFNNAQSDFSIDILPYGSINMSFYATPQFELEYYIKDNTKPCKRKYNMLGKTIGELDIPTGHFTASFVDVSSSDNILKYPISHIYKESDSDFGCGKNMRLNLHEKLERISDDILNSDFVYTDAHGEKYIFKEYFYYMDKSNIRQDISKESVSIDVNGNLSYDGHKVYKEERSATGLKVVTSLDGSGIKNIDLFETRESEIKQLEDTIVSYKKMFEAFSIVSKTGGELILDLKNHYDYQSGFDGFIDKANSSNDYIVLYDSEVSSYKALYLQGEEGSKQKIIVEPQINYLAGKKQSYISELKTYYKDYVNAQAELAKRKKYTPVNYVMENNIYKGFNQNGDLIVIGDFYGNVLVVEWNDKERIAKIQDNMNHNIIFNYNDNNILTSITDMHGRRTEFVYNSIAGVSVYLNVIRYSDEQEVWMNFEQGHIRNVYIPEVEWYDFAHEDNKLKKIEHYTNFDEIVHGKINGFTMNSLPTERIEYSSGQTVVTIQGVITEKETYKYNGLGNLTEYYRQENNVIMQAEKYDYKQCEFDNVSYAAKETLRQTNLSAVNFVNGDYKNIVLDKFNLPVHIDTNWVKINEQQTSSDYTEKNTTTDYFYDDNHFIKKSETLVSTKVYKANSTPEETQYKVVKKYNYNAQGSLVRSESYVVGEEQTSGKTIEEHVYDEKGREISSCMYNTLDTSSKFYTESEYGEDGKVTAEIDGTGENKTKLEYIDGTETVRTQILPNGSKFSYGHDVSGNITAITQSTEEGEENSTQILYTCGEVTELRSGNNVVNYAYDHKRRKTAVDLNGTKDYVKYSYADNVTEDGKKVNKVTAEMCNGDKIESVSDLRGNVLKTTYNGTEQTTCVYDSQNRLESVTDGITGVKTESEYDELDRVKKITGKEVTENYTYSDGNLATKTVTVSGKETKYAYGYKTNAAKELEYVEIDDSIKVYPQTDCLGRNTGKEITLGDNKLAEEHITYRKVGDHATNMPSTMRFGNHVVIPSVAEESKTQFVRLDNLKYKYDNCGNISEIWENGKLSARYSYDKLNRIVREDNKQLGKTSLFTYDNNGNILSKRGFAFTLKDTALLEELTSTDILYAYSGDRLLSFGEEICEYDGLGNPTVYRNKTISWANGRQMTAYDGNTFTYDGLGRRISKKKGSYTTNFTYDGNGKLLKQTDGTHTLEFVYDHNGIMGVVHNGTKYFYRKNAQGDIIALLDSNGAVVVKYVYDAWGKCEVHNPNGTVNDSVSHIGNLNPFRYRGYYYDTETKLYFLKTRYYDPEVGRFTTIDGIGYLAPTTLNGLNLYAYCGNNPITYVDYDGTDFGDWWNRIKIGAISMWNNFKRNVISSWDNLWDGLYNLPDRIGNTIGAFVENTSVSGGIGLGIGFLVNIFKLLGISALYKADFFSIKIDSDGIHIGGSGEKSFGFLIIKLVSKMWGIEEFIHYGDNNPMVSEKDWEFSFGIGGYFIGGFNLGFSVDLDKMFKEFKKIWGIT